MFAPAMSPPQPGVLNEGRKWRSLNPDSNVRTLNTLLVSTNQFIMGAVTQFNV
jgi:hypothetical protein